LEQRRRPNLFTYILLLMAILSIATYASRPKEAPISYAEVKALFEQEKVKSFTVEDTTLTLQLRGVLHGEGFDLLLLEQCLDLRI
jgi:hypothetical protein